MQTLIRCHILWHLIWVYSVCSSLTVQILRVNMALNLIFVLHIQIFFSQPTGYVNTYTVFNPITTLSEAIKMSINNTFFYKEEDTSAHDCEPIGVCALISLNAVFFIYSFFFFWSFTALSRIFYLYRADSSSKVGEKRRTWRKTT